MPPLPSATPVPSDHLQDDLAHNSPSLPHTSPSPDASSETDAEIDQLDSDSDSDELASASSTDKSEAARPPGCSLLPAVRLENILQADGMPHLLGHVVHDSP